MNRLIILLILLSIAFETYAKKKLEYPHAEIKVSYNYHKKFLLGSDEVVESDISFILLANRNQSKFYCPGTEFRDSLLSTPSGRAKERDLFNAAAAAYIETRDRNAMAGITYRTRLYVIKDFTNSTSTTYDRAGMVDIGYYGESFSEFDWEMVDDSTKTILGYQCMKATVNYHGREWTVWFAPEIPLQDGPWKFCGLPGLVMEATETTGQHSFSVTGIETCNQPIYPVYCTDYEKMGRLDMLRAERNYRDNSSAMFKAATGYDLGVTDAPITEETRKYDFLETDYPHD